MKKIENSPKTLRFKKEDIETINEARRTSGLWTTRNIQFNHNKKSAGTFKGIRRK